MKRVILLVMATLLVGMLLVSCAPQVTPAPPTSPPIPTPVVIRETVVVEVTPVPPEPTPRRLSSFIVPLCWLFNDEFVAPAAAIELGYYEEAGFPSVTLVSGGGSTGFDPVYAINGFDSNVRIGIQASMAEVIRAYAEGMDVVAIGALLQNEPCGFLTLITEDRRAQGPCDFQGRIVSMQTEAQWYVDALGTLCPPDEGGPFTAGVDFTVIPAGWTPDCLLAGQCDYYCAWATNQPFMLAQQGMVEGEDYEMFLVSSYLPFYYGDVLVTTRAYIEQNPETVENFVGATIKGLQFVLENPDEGVAIASRIEGVDPDHAEWRIPIQNELVISEDTEVHGLGWMNIEKVQEMIDFLYENSQISVTFNAEEIIDNSFLPGE